MEGHTIVSAYDASSEADDGLALAHLIARLTRAELVVVRVLDRMLDRPLLDGREGMLVRERVQETRRAILAAVPGDERVPIVPVLDPRIRRGLHTTASERDAEYIVLGSAHHGPLGRLVFGSSAEAAAHHAPCVVAVAPPGFRKHADLDPNIVSVGFDGSPASISALRHASRLAGAAGAMVRILSVQPHGLARELKGTADDDVTLEEAMRLARESSGERSPVEQHVVEGDPTDVLVSESANTGMLFIGARSHGAVSHVLLGSTATRAMRAGRCPVAVAPAVGHAGPDAG